MKRGDLRGVRRVVDLILELVGVCRQIVELLLTRLILDVLVLSRPNPAEGGHRGRVRGRKHLEMLEGKLRTPCRGLSVNEREQRQPLSRGSSHAGGIGE